MEALPGSTSLRLLAVELSEDPDVSISIAAASREGVIRLDRAVSQNLEDQAVEVCHLADAGVLDHVVDLLEGV